MEVYLTEQDIRHRIEELGREIDAWISDDEVLCVANLKGSFMFFADLIRRLKSSHLRVDFIATESYVGTQSSGQVRIIKDLQQVCRGQKLLVVEDIVDTGLTLSKVLEHFSTMHCPSEIKVATLLDKPSRRKVNMQADFVGFTIDDAFVVGYGLDYNEYYRNLPYIGILRNTEER
ncbi:hypoxanthine phosphoribosyltransferase [Thermospira aquatica]|uniref:Hypoxanthine phosphoribosyltransferase n=1 Tax=Thermospira aquatica TaxID=2828656 RepID=A0AAX3BCQ7_9SPIR|nr:hypoxanthine phosphoribosyltransferase [Thermospira aquatica]URA10055.1 hypoxanthine phosphoribosyltransferase [Thermospira aquatica]